MPLPRIQPIIPTRRKEPFDHADWLFDVKYDGFRALAYIERERARFVSRNGKPLGRFASLAAEVAAALAVDACRHRAFPVLLEREHACSFAIGRAYQFFWPGLSSWQRGNALRPHHWATAAHSPSW